MAAGDTRAETDRELDSFARSFGNQGLYPAPMAHRFAKTLRLPASRMPSTLALGQLFFPAQRSLASDIRFDAEALRPDAALEDFPHLRIGRFDAAPETLNVEQRMGQAVLFELVP
jgi:hypothetical protein